MVNVWYVVYFSGYMSQSGSAVSYLVLCLVLKEPLYCSLGRKVMTNLDSIFKSRDITLPAKVRLVKSMVFPLVMDVRVGL